MYEIYKKQKGKERNKKEEKELTEFTHVFIFMPNMRRRFLI